MCQEWEEPAVVVHYGNGNNFLIYLLGKLERLNKTDSVFLFFLSQSYVLLDRKVSSSLSPICLFKCNLTRSGNMK